MEETSGRFPLIIFIRYNLFKETHIKVFLIGGTGYLGEAAARELIARGHEVRSIALPPDTTGAYIPLQIPAQMELQFKDYLLLSDDELRECFSGCEGFVFAAGIEEGVNKFNVTPLERLLQIAKKSGVRHTVICGSYLSYFDKKWPKLELSRWHPYVKSHVEREDAAMSFADGNFNISVLELPYIFGVRQKGVRQGRVPVWTLLVKILRGMKRVTMYPEGGSTMITRNQAAQAIAGALESSTGAKSWPIGCYNVPWKEFLLIVHKNMGIPERLIITIPNWLIKPEIKYLENILKEDIEKIKSRFYVPKILDIQSAQTYIDRIHGCNPLGVKDDDIEAAIGETIRAAVEYLDRKLVIGAPV